MKNASRIAELEAQVQSLQAELEDAQQTITAIQAGQVDALVISTPQGDQVFSLQGADRSYRALIEQMQDGAATLSETGIVQFCNRSLGRLVNRPMESIIGTAAEDCFGPDDAEKFTSLRSQCAAGEANQELHLLTSSGQRIPVHVSLTQIVESGQSLIAMVVVDLTERKIAERALANQRTQEQLELFAQNAPAAIAMLDRDMRYVAVSQRWLEDYGLSGQDLRGRSHYEMFPSISERWKQIHQRCLAGNSERCEEDRFDRTDGSSHWIRWEIRPWYQSDGVVGGLVLYTDDITARKRAEEELRLTTDRFRLALKDSQIVVFHQDLDLRYTWIHNPALGYETQEVIGKTDVDLFERPRDAAVTEALKRAVINTGVGQRQEVTVHWQGVSRCYDLAVEPLHDTTGNIVGVTCAAIDITDRKQREEALQESEQRLRLAQNNASVGIWDWTPATGKVEWTPELEALFGLPPGTIKTYDDWRRRVHPDDIQRVEAERDDAIASRRLFDFEFRIIHNSGETRWLASRGKAIYGRDGEVVRATGINIDITDRKRTEEALRTSEERFRLAVGATHAMVYDLDVRGLRINALQGLAGLLGYDEAEAEPTLQWWDSHILPQDLAKCHAAFQAMHADPRDNVLEYRVRHKDGRILCVEDHARAVRDEAGRFARVVGTVVDVTERAKAAEALQESEKVHRISFDLSPCGMVRTDLETRYIKVNEKFCEITGYSADELLGMKVTDLTHPLDRETDAPLIADYFSGKTASYQSEKRYLKKDGTTFWVAVTARMVTDAQGRPAHSIAVIQDITARAKADEAIRQTGEELARAKEAAESANLAKDRFLATLSHELRTPLTPVRMAVSIWEDSKNIPTEFRQDLAMIRRNVDLECRLIDDMLDLNRIARGKLDLQFAPVNLNEETRHAVSNIDGDAAAKQVVLSFDPDAVEATVLGDAARLQQILWNLLRNAVKFTPPRGSVAVRTYNDPRGQACVEVRDSGTGIEPDTISRIFDAFEQGGTEVTRQFGGLGLGLSISKALCDMHGGTLKAHSDGKGKGATFTLSLPTVAPPEAPAEQRIGSTPASAGLSTQNREELLRILLVEDHQDTARIMKRLLGTFGYDVHAAGSVAEALKAAESKAFDLIISDIGLPDGSGFDLMRQVTAQRPVKGIALTGYGMEEDIKRGVAAGFTAHLTKPINVEQLELTIKRVIGKVSRVASMEGK